MSSSCLRCGACAWVKVLRCSLMILREKKGGKERGTDEGNGQTEGRRWGRDIPDFMSRANFTCVQMWDTVALPIAPSTPQLVTCIPPACPSVPSVSPQRRPACHRLLASHRRPSVSSSFLSLSRARSPLPQPRASPSLLRHILFLFFCLHVTLEPNVLTHVSHERHRENPINQEGALDALGPSSFRPCIQVRVCVCARMILC